MISYSLIRHDAKENKVEIAKSFFDKAIKASSGEDLSPYIAYAENIAVSEQNKKEFTNMLYKALNIDIHANPELSLTNYINQKRANWLLDNIDEFFY
jgi:predicted anti-sigma-YlaC factor YlaD